MSLLKGYANFYWLLKANARILKKTMPMVMIRKRKKKNTFLVKKKLKRKKVDVEMQKKKCQRVDDLVVQQLDEPGVRYSF